MCPIRTVLDSLAGAAINWGNKKPPSYSVGPWLECQPKGTAVGMSEINHVGPPGWTLY